MKDPYSIDAHYSRLELLKESTKSDQKMKMAYISFGLFLDVEVSSSDSEVQEYIDRWNEIGISIGAIPIDLNKSWCVYSRCLNSPIWYPEVIEIPQNKSQKSICIVLADSRIYSVELSGPWNEYIHRVQNEKNLKMNAYWLRGEWAKKYSNVVNNICAKLE
mgnify:CR=1 FL=1